MRAIRFMASVTGAIALFGFYNPALNWPETPDNPIHNWAFQYQQQLFLAGCVAFSLIVALILWRSRQRSVRCGPNGKRHTRRYRKMLLDLNWDTNMTPSDFEKRCADYLALKGWQTRITKNSWDQGYDVIARKSKRTLVIQCKFYSTPIGNKAVQEVYSGKAYAGATHAAVISNQRYTRSAHKLATRTHVRLIHFTELAKLAGSI